MENLTFLEALMGNLADLDAALSGLFGAWAGFVWTKIVFWASLLGALFFTFRYAFVQFRSVPHAIDLVRGKYDNPNEVGQITHFQALTAALSGTIGLGNIAGVAIAIAIGGPGAVFWMWIIGIFGMASKFIECTLGTHFRDVDNETGDVRGGPMYYITKGLGKQWKPLAIMYALAIMLAAIGAGCMFQTNQAASALASNYAIKPWISGMVLWILGALVIVGGIQRIGKVTSKIVPLMCIIYVVGSIIICVLNISKLPAAISIIIQDAFTGSAVGGGFIFTAVAGIRRAIFSNEAGLGSASIAHAAVKTNYPIREGFVAALGPFIDTVVVCTATAFIIIMSGSFGSEMYQKAHQNETIHFSSSSDVPVSSDTWGIVSTDVPQQQNMFQSLHQGDALKISKTRGQSELTPLKLKPFNLPHEDEDGIRFSYYKIAGDLSVQFLRQDGSIIDEIKLGKFPDTTEKLELTGAEKVGKWHSRVILFNDSFINDVFSTKGDEKAQPEGYSIAFVSSDNHVEWYLDRIETIQNRSGVDLTTASFDTFLHGFGKHFITISVFFFAFSSMITWAYYGETAAGFLFGKTAISIYKWIFVSAAYLGAVTELSTVLNFSDLVLGLAVIPNIIALLLLSNKVGDWLKSYNSKLKSGDIVPYKRS